MRYHYLQGMDSRGRMADPIVYGFAGEGEHLFFAHVFEDEAEGGTALEVAEQAYFRHNQDDRPRSQQIRSLSCGDVVVVEAEGGPVPLLCAMVGFREVEGDAKEALLDIAHRRAYGVVPIADLQAANVRAAEALKST